MKKSTLIMWAIVFGFLALVIFQNQSFFLPSQTLRINLGVIDEYQSPVFPTAIFFLIFFFSGIFIAYLFNLPARFRASRTVKKLNATIASCNNELSELKREMDALKGMKIPAEAPATETKIETDETQKVTSDRLIHRPAEQTGEFSVEKQEANPTENSEEKPSEKNL